MAILPQLINLSDELKFSKEFSVVSSYENIRTPVQILNRNFQSLNTHFQKYQYLAINKSLLSTRIYDRIELIEYMAELHKEVHNYVASSQTLIDLQRVHYKKYHLKEGTFLEYQAKIEQDFIRNPLCRFIKELRNYFLHKSSPPIYSNRSFNTITEQFNAMILFDKIKLLDSFNWSSESKKFITSLDNEICISNLFKSYHEHVSNFQEWYKRHEQRIFFKEYEFVQKKENEIKIIGLKSILESIGVRKSLNIDIFEQTIVRFSDFDDAKEIFEIKDSKERAKKIINSIQKTVAIPQDVFLLIIASYDLL